MLIWTPGAGWNTGQNAGVHPPVWQQTFAKHSQQQNVGMHRTWQWGYNTLIMFFFPCQKYDALFSVWQVAVSISPFVRIHMEFLRGTTIFTNRWIRSMHCRQGWDFGIYFHSSEVLQCLASRLSQQLTGSWKCQKWYKNTVDCKVWLTWCGSESQKFRMFWVPKDPAFWQPVVVQLRSTLESRRRQARKGENNSGMILTNSKLVLRTSRHGLSR